VITHGGISKAKIGIEVKESIFSLGGIRAGITTVRWWIDGQRGGYGRKADSKKAKSPEEEDPSKISG